MTEEWREVSGWPYRVSSLGRVINAIGKALKMREDRGGYLYANIYRTGTRKTVKAHCLVAAAFIGVRPDGLQINHKDGIKTNNASENLEYVTPRQNIHHARTLPTWPAHPSTSDETWSRGEKNARAILNKHAVAEIRKRSAAGESYSKLGIAFGVNKSTIACAVRGKSWA